ncbi:PACE efflux transporter [Pseudomonas vanderleydeniana]|uniref:PACE efflux transporter n=1 Tax=Pseudomonas vanderleydeniana TaxID=2745495 RepID=A0A9E6PJ52_9PSED|nr:PACE efflux transporter [Pseudomonas vanderleydeniana]QXI27380.1 PACE efflux transporter [Pseudomonas vanderleydeniana]
MQGLKRKLIFVALYEVIGMTLSALTLAALSGTAPSSTGPLAVIITSIAVTWNFIFTSLFERWESRQRSRTRTVKRRIAHAVGFQLTLIVFLIPLIAWWMTISLLQAFLLDVVLIILIPFYTFAFNWAFDRVFGLPLSALPENLAQSR